MSKDKKAPTDAYEPLSDEELAMLKASQEGEIDRSTLPPHDNSDKAKAKRYVKKNKWSVLFVIVTVFLLLAVIASLIIINIKNKASTADFTITLLDGEEYTVPYDEAMIDDVLYLDLIKIAEYADLVISGDPSTPKITCPDNTYVRFENGSASATVNGTRVKLGGTAKTTAASTDAPQTCLVPYSFIKKLFSHPVESDTPGIRTVFSQNDNSIIIGRVTYDDGAPLPIGFDAKLFESAEEFQLMALKEKYPSREYACEKKTKLVNANNPLGENYTPQGLFSLNELNCPIVEGGQYSLVKEAAFALCDMLNVMENSINKQNSILVTSAYRSYSKQEVIYESYIKDLMNRGYTRKEAEDEIGKTSARAGYSEHQTGLCVDFIERGHIELDETFENCKAFVWLYDNAHKYGFILRYPKDKVAITGYSYEPWHFRFVGIDAATIIYQDNLCLEEYLAQY